MTSSYRPEQFNDYMQKPIAIKICNTAEGCEEPSLRNALVHRRSSIRESNADKAFTKSDSFSTSGQKTCQRKGDRIGRKLTKW